MFQSELVLGFFVDDAFQTRLQLIDVRLLQHFITSKDGEYLKEITVGDKRYFGKSIEPCSDIQSIELVESHIYSILKKLVPDYPYEKTELELFAWHLKAS